MSSLQDQLLKAGLTTKQKARQANSDKRRKNKQKRSGANVEASLQEQVKQDLAKQQAQKLEKDKALNEQKKAELAKKEQHQRILQILTHHSLSDIDGDLEYNYTFDGKIKKLHVSKVIQDALVNGRLALCGLDEKTYVVTAETAEKLATIDPQVVLLKNDRKQEEQIDEDDPYADFQIPDDLMW
ncbi:DUF2058 domain-containing protein [Thalassotalea sp. LPB0316]|uniref:DUF2058 domain-containing protein n=1 Tax=Thalassotalea sp. LPB0316 TaxID=2769490 RepID=UPI0018690B85|nr:DUF2058 domain-containing protein [Thalassotalea sp. LPB0316]QOL25565.1 DUF2058 domain-containing protein [Thalassotalea sp. LPB0316]